MENPFTLLAMLSALPGAYLSFKRSLIPELQDQMVDRRNPAGIGRGTVRLPYRILAYIFVGKQDKWMDLFDPLSPVIQRLLKTDKTVGLRIFVWFALTFIFLFLAWFFD